MKRIFIAAPAFFLAVALYAAGAVTATVSVKEGLRIRSGPAQNAQKLGVIPEGTAVVVLEEKDPEVTVAGRKGRWTRVNWNGTIGWVFGGFLDKTPGGKPGALPSNFPRKWISLTKKGDRLVIHRWCFAETPCIAITRERKGDTFEFNMGQESVFYTVLSVIPVKNGFRFELKDKYDERGDRRTVTFTRDPRRPGVGTWTNLGGAWQEELFVDDRNAGRYPVVSEKNGDCGHP